MDKYIEMELKKIRKKAIRPAVRKDIDELLDYCNVSGQARKALEDRTEMKFDIVHGSALLSRKYK